MEKTGSIQSAFKGRRLQSTNPLDLLWGCGRREKDGSIHGRIKDGGKKKKTTWKYGVRNFVKSSRRGESDERTGGMASSSREDLSIGRY